MTESEAHVKAIAFISCWSKKDLGETSIGISRKAKDKEFFVSIIAGPQPLPEEHVRILRELDCYLGEGLDRYYSYDFVFPWDE